jgi:hypothetical protein
MARNLNEIIHLLYQSGSRDLHAQHESGDVVWVAPAAADDIPAHHALNVTSVGPHVASLETMQAIQTHNPESLWSVWRAPNLAAQSPTLAGFYAFLHLTPPGHEALAARTLDTHDPDLRLVVPGGMRPDAVYIWAVVAKALGSGRYGGLPFYATAGTFGGLNRLKRYGFDDTTRSDAELGDLFRFDIPAVTNAA